MKQKKVFLKELMRQLSYPNKSEETNQKPAGGFLIAHFKRYMRNVTP